MLSPTDTQPVWLLCCRWFAHLRFRLGRGLLIPPSPNGPKGPKGPKFKQNRKIHSPSTDTLRDPGLMDVVHRVCDRPGVCFRNWPLTVGVRTRPRAPEVPWSYSYRYGFTRAKSISPRSIVTPLSYIPSPAMVVDRKGFNPTKQTTTRFRSILIIQFRFPRDLEFHTGRHHLSAWGAGRPQICSKSYSVPWVLYSFNVGPCDIVLHTPRCLIRTSC